MKRIFAPLCAHDFSSHDLTVLKQLKRFINKPGPRLCHNTAIWGSELTGAVGEPVVLNLRKNRTRELPTESSKNEYDSRIFFSFLFIDYLYV